MIQGNIQQNIKDNVSKETFRSAIRLLNSGTILACFTKKNTTLLSLKTSKDNVRTIALQEVIKKIEHYQYNTLTSEDIAAFLHYQKYHHRIHPANKPAETAKATAPLSSGDTTYTPPAPDYSAKLYLYSKDGYPNASSAWEHCNINVKLTVNKQEYIGNINKLRKIRFDEDKAVNTLTISDFNSQSRQIIRFLTQFAEPDGAGYALKSDIMSELFHSLINFSNFYFNEKQIIIHQEHAELVTAISESDKNYKTINLLIEGKLLPVVNPLFIFGKAGLWIGIKGEYWWAPALVDLIWLRKFLLADKPIKTDALLPIRHIETNDYQLTSKTLTADFLIDLLNDNTLILNLSFSYKNKNIEIDSNRLSAEQDTFWLRDKVAEKNILDEISCFGFKQKEQDNNTAFILDDIEAIGIFIEYMLPKWQSDTAINLLFTADAADFIFSGKNQLQLKCSSPISIGSHVQLDYIIEPVNEKITIRNLISSVKKNRRYILSPNKHIVRIPDNIGTFILQLHSIIHITSRPKTRFNIPRGSILYWVEKAKNIPCIIPKEWNNIHESLKDIPKGKDTPDVPISQSFLGELRKYQRESVSWMSKMIKKKFNIILADEMGLGKTVQSLALINSLKQKKKNFNRCIVVCPTSLTDNWNSEAAKFTPHLKTLLINGANRKTLFDSIQDHELIITSYALIKRDIEEYSKLNFDLLILDEAQHIKNPATINAKVCKSIPAKHRLVLTGTPLENSPEDIWSIFDFLNPGMLGSKDSFKENYSKIENDMDKQKELAQRIAPFILRRHKKDVEQLPEKTEQILSCEMSPCQQKLYDKILHEGQIRYQSFSTGKLSRFDVLTSLLRLRQLCCHPKLLPEITNHAICESAKTDLLEELIFETIDSGHRPLIFSQFTSLLSIIRDWCDKQNITYEYLDGSTKNRLEKVNNFNSNQGINLFLLSLKAGGVGLNLTGADTVIIYDPWWNPSVEAQATDRTHRIGQNKQITTIKLVVKNSIEEKILNLQQRKQNLFNGIIETSSSFRKLTDRDIDYLLH